MILTPLQKLPKNVGDLGKLIAAKGFKGCPKSNKSPNLVTLVISTHLVASNRAWKGWDNLQSHQLQPVNIFSIDA